MTKPNFLADCSACRRGVSLDDGWVEWLEADQRLSGFRVVHRQCSRSASGEIVGARDQHLSHFVGTLGLARLTARIASAKSVDSSLANVLDVIATSISRGYMAVPPGPFEAEISGYEARYKAWRSSPKKRPERCHHSPVAIGDHVVCAHCGAVRE